VKFLKFIFAVLLQFAHCVNCESRHVYSIIFISSLNTTIIVIFRDRDCL